MRILIADDQPEFIASIAPHLKKARCEFEHVACADAAVERLKEIAFDLVLTDLQMPPGNWGGLELIKAVRAVDGSVPIIVVSGRGSVAESVKALRLGANDYIQKENFSEEFQERIVKFYVEPFALNDMPSIIGHLYRAYLEERAPNAKASRLIDAFEASIRLVTCLLIAELSVLEMRPISELLRDMDLQRPTLGKYLGKMYEILKRDVHGEFSGMLLSSDLLKGRRFCDELVACRNNKLGHSSTLSPTQATEVVDSQHSNLVNVLNAIAPIRRFELMRVDCMRYDGSAFATDGQLLKGIDLHVSTTTRVLSRPVASGHVVLLRGDRIIADCSPLVDIASTKSSLLYSYQLFDSVDGDMFRSWTVPRLDA